MPSEARQTLPNMQTMSHPLLRTLQWLPVAIWVNSEHLNLVSNPDLVFTYLSIFMTPSHCSQV